MIIKIVQIISMANKFDITIIGGSFSGMTAALSLAKISPDLKIAVIEKIDIKNENRKKDGKGYAISNKSLKLFKEIGVFDEATKDSGVIENIKITDYKSSVFVDFLSKEVGETNFGALIESYKVHNALRDALLKQSNVTLFCPNSYKDILFGENFSEVELESGEKIISKLVLACDGRFSDLRKKFEIATDEKNYGQSAIVFNIRHEKSHKNIAWEKFLPGGPLAILPLKDKNSSSIVWISKSSLANEIINLDNKNFIHQLEKKLENVLGKVEKVEEKFSHPLIMVKASKFYHEKMLLVGDSACGVHPIAGQGLNLAFESIVILRDLIRQNFHCANEINSCNLIESYNKQARLNARKMVAVTDLLNSLFESKSLTFKLARDLGLLALQKVPKLKKILIKNAGGF